MKNGRPSSHILLRLGLAALAAAAVLSAAGCTNGGAGENSGTGAGGETTPETTTTTTAQTTTTVQTTTTLAAAPGDITTGWSTDSVNIRTGPGTEYYAIGGLHVGEQVTILGKEGDWYKIKFTGSEDGVGYVNAQYISATVVNTTAAPPTTATTTAVTPAPAAQ